MVQGEQDMVEKSLKRTLSVLMVVALETLFFKAAEGLLIFSLVI